MSTITVTCPHCEARVVIGEPKDYAPVFHLCHSCNHRFLAEMRKNGLVVMKENDAPCMSNPECREIENNASCED